MRSRSTSLASGCQQLVKEAAAVLSAPFTISTWGRELQTQRLPTEVSKQGGWTIPGAVYSSSLSQQPWQLHLWLCRVGWPPQAARMAQPDPSPSTHMCCSWTRVTAYRWHQPHRTAVHGKWQKPSLGARMNPAVGRNKVLHALQHTYGARASWRVVGTKPWRIRFARIPIRTVSTRRCQKSLSP